MLPPEYFASLPFRTFVELLADRVARFGDRPFLIEGDRTVSYGEFSALVDRLAGSLHALGLRPGGLLPALLPNSIEFVAAWFAAVRLGAGYAPLNTDLTGEQLAYQIEDAGADPLVIDAQYLPHLPERSRAVKRLIVVDRSAATPQPPAHYTRLSWAELLAGTAPRPAVEVTPDHPYLIMYSSGTTGRPKAVLGIHSSELYKARLAELCHLDGDSVGYLPLPMYHGLAMGVVHLTIWAGARIVLAPRFSASAFWRDVRRWGCTYTGHVGSLLEILLRQPESPDDRHHSLKLSFGVGATAESWARLKARFGVDLCEFYGSTETGLITFNPPPGLIGSVGKLVSRVEARFVDAEGQPVPEGSPGEMLVRPTMPATMAPGYLHTPFATEAGWYRTGDLLRQDPDGNLYFLGRCKDTIRHRGKNIVPEDIERPANAHPAVLAAAAVAVPSDLGDDEVKLCVQLRPGYPLTADELIAYLDRHLPAFMVPRYVRFLTALPYTPTHKLQREQLRGQIEPDCWDRHGQATARPAERAGVE